MLIHEEKELRSQVDALVIEWGLRRTPTVSGDHKGDFVEMIAAAHVISDEARISVQRWVDAGRRAGLSWAEVGEALGISKQAAQQRFRSDFEEGPTPEHDVIVTVRGASAFNEVGLLRREGLKGHELVGVGALELYFRKTPQKWEYSRVLAVSASAANKKATAQRWTFVSSWFPFHYLKRPVGEVTLLEDGDGTD